MQIHGLNKTTLLDYPQHVAATVFTGACNFRCPFCHNGSLAAHPELEPVIPEEELFTFLEKRKNILSGVCITGGEPTIHPDLPEFIMRIKELGYLVKLDTNGYRPDVIQDLLERRLIDYIAMDIKSSPANYAEASGLPGLDFTRIGQSAALIMDGTVPYEFRTTVVRELHKLEDFIEIGRLISGCCAYYLQSYKKTPQVLQPGFHSYPKEELLAFAEALRSYIQYVGLRGVD